MSSRAIDEICQVGITNSTPNRRSPQTSVRKQKSLTDVRGSYTMLSKRRMGFLEVENEKSATDPIHFEETLAFSVLCSCRLSQIGIQKKMTGKPWGTSV